MTANMPLGLLKPGFSVPVDAFRFPAPEPADHLLQPVTVLQPDPERGGAR